MANVVLEVNGDVEKMLRSWAKMETKVQELEAKLKEAGKAGEAGGEKIARAHDKAGESAKRAGDKHKELFGHNALTRMNAYGMAVAGVTAAVGVLAKGFEDAGRAAQEAGQRIAGAFPAMTKLLQVSTGPEHYQQLVGEVNKLRVAAGIPQEAAAEAVFMAQSAGLVQHMPTFARLGKIGMDIPTAITGVQKTLANFPQAGTPAEILNMYLAAAAGSPVGAQEMARATLTSAANYAAMGGSAEENLAMTAVLTKAFKSPDIAGERLGSLAGKVVNMRERGLMGFQDWTLPFGAGGQRVARFQDPRLTGINLLRRIRGLQPLDVSQLRGRELIEALPGLGLAGALRTQEGRTVGAVEWLGDQGAITAMQQVVKQRADISATTAAITAAKAGTGGAGDVLGGMEKTFAGQPLLAGELAARAGEQAAGIAGEARFGGLDQIRRRAASLMSQLQAESGEGAFLRGVQATNRWFESWFDPGRQAEWELQRARPRERALRGTTAETDALLAELRAIRQAAEQTARNSRGPAAGRWPTEDK